ncbi:hypothetical protein BDZ97DRAFT_1758039 [Flammula alnicola]|nr:hypothetical protein BDZ97DRAFT_1758039 [Flammula alnicola]
MLHEKTASSKAIQSSGKSVKLSKPTEPANSASMRVVAVDVDVALMGKLTPAHGPDDPHFARTPITVPYSVLSPLALRLSVSPSASSRSYVGVPEVNVREVPSHSQTVYQRGSPSGGVIFPYDNSSAEARVRFDLAHRKTKEFQRIMIEIEGGDIIFCNGGYYTSKKKERRKRKLGN